MIQKNVIDINTGLGGRAYGFLKAGYKIEVLVDNDKENCEILKSIFQNTVILENSIIEIVPETLPEVGVISAKYVQQPFSTASKFKLERNYDNKVILNIVKMKRPSVFLLEVPLVYITSKRKDLENYMQQYRELGYKFSYSVIEEKLSSGYPINGRQAFFVGVKDGEEIDLENLFRIEEPFEKELILEDANNINAWYRNIKNDFNDGKEGDYYLKKRNDFNKTKLLYNGFMSESYVIDKIGLRRITHNEFAEMKGLYDWNFDTCANKRRMYQKLAYESNTFSVYKIVSVIDEYIEGNRANKAVVQNKAASPKKLKKVDKPQIIFPKLFIKKIHIRKLKGIYNLDIEFEKNLVAIMGVNGTGKSTILHALACVNKKFQKGEDYKFNYFFTPTPDSIWNDSFFTIVSYDENEKKEITKNYYKKEKRWINYDERPQRDIYYLGVSTCIPEIELEKKTSFIKYISNHDNDKNAKNIINDASAILNKPYADLLMKETSKKKYIGVSTQEGFSYSALSMGAGEQRIIKILHTIYNANHYSMILIDELDLLLHVDAFRKLVRKMYELANKKHIQIIFTTHSMEMAELSEFVDIRYIEKRPQKYMVYDSINPDLRYSLSGKIRKQYIIYVEDKFAEAVVRNVAKETHMFRHISIISFGSIENGFTVAAGKVLSNEEMRNMLVVMDGDRYISEEEKRKQLEKVLSGNESWHDDKISKALSAITQFNLPINTPPEKFIWELLKNSNEDNEYVTCAKQIKAVQDTHEYIDQIKRQMGDDTRAYDDIVNIVSADEEWKDYVINIKKWLLEKYKEVNTESVDVENE